MFIIRYRIFVRFLLYIYSKSVSGLASSPSLGDLTLREGVVFGREGEVFGGNWLTH
jgi:hypothetical protein